MPSVVGCTYNCSAPRCALLGVANIVYSDPKCTNVVSCVVYIYQLPNILELANTDFGLWSFRAVMLH